MLKQFKFRLYLIAGQHEILPGSFVQRSMARRLSETRVMLLNPSQTDFLKSEGRTALLKSEETAARRQSHGPQYRDQRTVFWKTSSSPLIKAQPRELHCLV